MARYDLGGTLRERDAAATLAWVRPFLPACGITRLANVTGLDRIGIPVWMCVRPNGRSLAVSQGKGTTHELAQASAVMEAIESFHAEHAPPPVLVASCRAARRRHAVLGPRRFTPGLRWRTFSDDRDLCWSAATDLASGEPLLLPHVRVTLDWSHPHPDAGLLQVTSTGLASGNSRAEALCHALFEVIERDAEWRWQRSSSAAERAGEIDPTTVDTPHLRAILDRLAAAEVQVRMHDITSRVGIPVFACEIHDAGPVGRIGPFGGYGCHLSPEIALSRAVTEAVQSRLTYIAGSRDDMYPASYEPGNPAAAGTPAASPTRDFRRAVTPPMGTTFEEDLQITRGLLREAGMDRVAAVDLTHPEIGIPVVMAVVPGMRETDGH